MGIDTRRVKPFVLPGAIIIGFLFHQYCEILAGIVPFLVFILLLLTFASTELRTLKFKKIDLFLMLYQVMASVAIYFLSKQIFKNDTIAQGLMLGALCPVAGSVTVVAVLLGAERKYTVAYTIIGNLLVCILAPIIFTYIANGEADFTDSFYAIFKKISSIIGLPFFIILILQNWAQPVAKILCKYSGSAFYVWSLALLLTLGQTINFIFLHHEGNWNVIATLCIGSIIICLCQFFIGRFIGRRSGDTIAGQQLLFQKNSAMGIWMANTYLNPLASSFLAFYSIWQNILNSWQIWRRDKDSTKTV